MKKHFAFAAILITFLVAGCPAMWAQQETKPASKEEPRVRNWYKIEITLNEFQDGKKTNTRAYTLKTDDDGNLSDARFMDKVPIVTAGTAQAEAEKLINKQFQYLDVDFRVYCWIRDRQGHPVLSISVEQENLVTSTEALRLATSQPIIHRFSMSNTAFVTLGQPMLISSADDPNKANHKYTMEATVTKLNP